MPKKAIGMGAERLRGLVAGAMENAGAVPLVGPMGREALEPAVNAIAERLRALTAKPTPEELAAMVRQAVAENAPKEPKDKQSALADGLDWVLLATTILSALDLPSSE